MSSQLTNISGELPKLKDKKIYNLSLTRIGQKRKRQMAEPIETVLIRAQQSFEIAGGLNPEKLKLINTSRAFISSIHKK